MPDQPLVSIIIPTYNRAHLIGETLDSVLAQTYQNWECIVVDDGSTDDTDKVMAIYCAKDSRIQYQHRPQDRLPGGSAARNYGFEISKGEYIQWFDDDDIMMSSYITLKIDKFMDDIQFVICSGTYVDENLKFLKHIQYKNPINLFKDYTLWNIRILTPSVLFSKKFLMNKNLFNLSLQRGQEAEFFARIFFKLPKEKYFILNKPLFLYRQHKETKTTKNKAYNIDFKTSEIFVATENLKRSVELKDRQLIQYFYSLLIHFLFRAIEYQDFKNAKLVLRTLVKIIRPLNSWLVLQLQIVGSILISHKRGYYKIEKYFKTYIIRE